MPLNFCEFLSILLAALVAGVFWGPWVALTRSLRSFPEDTFFTIVRRMDRNLGPLMTLLMPASLLSIIPVLWLSYSESSQTFSLTLAGFVCFVATLVVTVTIEVPIVKQIVSWTPGNFPGDWQKLRDRWMLFHILRVVGGILGFALLVAGAIF